MAAGSKSKRKGSNFERFIANFLTEQHGDKFMRTAHSGAYTGKSNAFRKDSMAADTQKAFLGDILPPEGYILVSECKNYAGITGGFNGIISGDCKGLDKWLDEVIFDSVNALPHILFFKITSLGTYFVLPTKFFPDVKLVDNKISHSVYYTVEDFEYKVIHLDFYPDLKDYIELVLKDEKWQQKI